MSVRGEEKKNGVDTPRALVIACPCLVQRAPSDLCQFKRGKKQNKPLNMYRSKIPQCVSRLDGMQWTEITSAANTRIANNLNMAKNNNKSELIQWQHLQIAIIFWHFFYKYCFYLRKTVTKTQLVPRVVCLLEEKWLQSAINFTKPPSSGLEAATTVLLCATADLRSVTSVSVRRLWHPLTPNSRLSWTCGSPFLILGASKKQFSEVQGRIWRR